MIPRATLKVNVIGQRSRSPGQKCDFRSFSVTGNVTMVKGHEGQGQSKASTKAAKFSEYDYCLLPGSQGKLYFLQ